MHISVIFLPLLSFFILGVMGPWLGKKISHILSCTFMALSFGAALGVFYDVVFLKNIIHHSLFPFIECGSFSLSWGFYIDTLSALMMVVISCVSFLVHVYSVGYMHHDQRSFKFMAYLGLFTFMMLALVTGDTLLQVFFGWEGVGLASYLLIGYWYDRPSACVASMKAFIVNRVGDLGLVLGMGCLFMTFQTLDIPTILSTVSDVSGATYKGFGHTFSVLEVIAGLLFIGAMGKSAQLGLHVWLPDAMEGPTPVSALIHAATMVTAGVFLVARFSSLYELAPFVKNIITWVGALTAVFAGTIAMTQTDIKRVIAYSTCSQLGYMFFAEGLGNYSMAMFHLTTHAFFKALLFLGAGSVIHAMSDEQDMNRMGGIYRFIPITYAFMWVGSAALSGLPFFAGFYSKDAILETAQHAPHFTGQMAYILGLIAAFLTAFYSWRLLYITFHGKPRAHEHVMGHIHEPGLTMLCPLAILAVGAIFSGYIGFPYFMSQDFWGQALMVVHNENHVSHWNDHLPIIISMGGIAAATWVYVLYPQSLMWVEKIPGLYQLFFHKWYIDALYDKIIVKPLKSLGDLFWTTDTSFIDAKILNKIADDCKSISQRLSQIHTGFMIHYISWMLLGVMGVLLFLLLK